MALCVNKAELEAKPGKPPREALKLRSPCLCLPHALVNGLVNRNFFLDAILNVIKNFFIKAGVQQKLAKSQRIHRHLFLVPHRHAANIRHLKPL